MMALCIIPETLVAIYFSRPQLRWLRQLPVYRVLRIIGGAVGCFILIVANLIGFGTGSSRVGDGVSSMLTWESLGTALIAFILMFFAAVFAVRDRDQKEKEKRALRLQYNIKSEK
jgi:hypothetical protein